MSSTTGHSWEDGVCIECGRETGVVYVDEHGQMCFVCLDQAAEQGDSDAQEVFK